MEKRWWCSVQSSYSSYRFITMVGRRCKTAFSINSTVSAQLKQKILSNIIKIKTNIRIIEAQQLEPDNLEGSLSILGTKGTVILEGFLQISY